MSSLMKALVVESKGKIVVKDDVPKPELEDGQALVAVKAVALNPTDWKHADGISEDGSLLGCDLAGVVEQVKGDSPLKVGQRVAGFVHGGRFPDRGSFAQYAKVDSSLAWPIPDSIDFEQGAALAGVGPHTAMQHLFVRHGLPWPGEGMTNEPFLIWSGATSVGLYAIQLAKLIGCTVITTASPKNWDLLKSLGADDVYDYRDAEVSEKISAKYPTLAHALDCVTTDDSTKQISRSLGKHGGLVTTLNMPKPDDNAGRENVKVQVALGYTLLGKPFQIRRMQVPAIPTDYEAAKKWATIVPKLVESGKLKCNPIFSQQGGLEKIPDGLDLLRQNKVSAQKVTFSL